MLNPMCGMNLSSKASLMGKIETNVVFVCVFLKLELQFTTVKLNFKKRLIKNTCLCHFRVT